MDIATIQTIPTNLNLANGNGRRVAFKTPGFRMNQYETDALANQFYEAGYKIVGFNENDSTGFATGYGEHYIPF
ncbi:hypothetical protein [Marinilabilia rubra]|uniref:hypothetical protein n=1 Tax=Marinilabilia rubra TaxID=2162893 RepID=UPI0018E07FBC|nr:hypothetical protein [Marinilabilia rubra]